MDRSEKELPFDDKFIAPFPDMVIYRVTTGLYYQLYNLYNEAFATHFGDLFELYVSKIINRLNLPGRIISEKEIDLILPIRSAKGGTPKRRPENEENSFRILYCIMHIEGKVASRAEVPSLQHSAVSNFLQHPGNPLRPLAVGLVVADEEVFHRCKEV